MNRPPRVSVVIPTFQRAAMVQRALHALSRQTLDPCAYEVIICIDGSEDGSREMVASLAAPYALRALWQPHAGRAAACNTALRAANGELVVLLDDDMEPEPGFLAAHVRAQASATDLAVLGAVPVRLDPTSPLVVRYIGNKFNGHLAKLAQPGYHLRLRDFYSGNCSIRRDTLLRVGLFDEAFRVYGNEDLELAVRLARGGVRIVYEPEALAYQDYTKDFAGLARDTVAKGRTAVLLASIHPDTFRELKLSAYADEFPRWHHARAVLLHLSDRWASLPEIITRLVQLLERGHIPGLGSMYVLALDYFYWLGARSALREQPCVRASLLRSAGPRVNAWG